MSHPIFSATTKACRNSCRLFLAILFLCMTAELAESAVVTLAWNPNSEGDLAGYALSYGTTSGQLTTTIDVGNTTIYAFAIPDPTKVYYIAIRAYDTSGLFSPFSNEVATTPVVPALTVTNMVANLPSPQPPGATITFSATATGGTAPYQYKWWVANGTTSTLGRDWSTSNTFAWTPSTASPNYLITVWARNASSTIDKFDNPSAKLSLSFVIGSATAAATVSSVSPNSGAIGGGTSVTITGTNFASGADSHVWRNCRDKCGGRQQHVDHGPDAGACGRSGECDRHQPWHAGWNAHERLHLCRVGACPHEPVALPGGSRCAGDDRGDQLRRDARERARSHSTACRPCRAAGPPRVSSCRSRRAPRAAPSS